jgi:hypothetical protein
MKTEVGRARVAIRKINKEIEKINEGRISNIGYIEAGAGTPIRALAKFLDNKRTDKIADKKVKSLLIKAERLKKSLEEK